jgi:LmbE family N-acetylglucosaminyl deacetylase/glycosyltransferase involved in cell wall biosynthesis
MNSFGLVIPAFNEGNNLARVLEPVCAVDWLQQIVIVDDGSGDSTFALAQQYAGRDRRITALRLPKNQGKAAAMLAGVQSLQTDFVIFLDADLIGLRPDHINQLCRPVLLGSSDMAVAIFRRGGTLTDTSHRLAPSLSGQRCLSRLAAERSLLFLAKSKYGIETGLTYYAKKMGWRCHYVYWSSVTHVMKELKLGCRTGVYSRWRMYGQILLTILFITAATWNWSIFWRPFDKQLLSWRVGVMVGLAILLVWFASYEHLQAYTELRLHNLATWQPQKYERILIFAPHPDDEVLSSGGVIGAALKADPPAEVRVVVATNGDASFSTVLLNGYNPISKSGYQKLARARQQESLQAMQALGLPPEQTQFWGFPDQGLELIWRRHWVGDKPYRSGYSTLTHTAGSLHSPENIPYTSRALLEQIRLALADFQPDAVILPHPQDAHPDHRALANFIILAVALNQAEGWSSPPQLFGYVVWLSTAPRPISIRLDKELQKLPARFSVNPEDWLRFPLTTDILESKITALKAYQTQIRGLGTLLRSAGSGTELFNHLLLHHVPYLSTPVSFTPEGQWQSLPYRQEWGLPGVGRLVPAPIALWSAADSVDLWLAAQLPRSPGKSTKYIFVIRTVNNIETAEIQVEANQLVKTADGNIYVAARLPLARLEADQAGQVFMLSVQARVPGQAAVTRSQWQLLYVSRNE